MKIHTVIFLLRVLLTINFDVRSLVVRMRRRDRDNFGGILVSAHFNGTLNSTVKCTSLGNLVFRAT